MKPSGQWSELPLSLWMKWKLKSLLSDLSNAGKNLRDRNFSFLGEKNIDTAFWFTLSTFQQEMIRYHFISPNIDSDTCAEAISRYQYVIKKVTLSVSCDQAGYRTKLLFSKR